MESTQVLFEHAEELEQLARPEEALQEYGDLIDARMGGTDTLLRRAFLLDRLGRYAEARRDLEQAAALEPWSGWALLRLAQMLRARDKPWLAAAFAQEAVNRQPEMAEIRLNAAAIFGELDWLDRAFAVVRPLPTDMEGWWGGVRRDSEAAYRRRHAETAAMVRRSGRSAVAGTPLREVVTLLLSVGRVRAARRACEAAIRNEPAAFADFELYARVLARQSGLADAVGVLRAIGFLFEHKPDHRRVLSFMEGQLSI